MDFQIRFPIVLAEYTPCGTNEPLIQSEPIHSIEELLAHPLVDKYGIDYILDTLRRNRDSESVDPAEVGIPAGRVYR